GGSRRGGSEQSDGLVTARTALRRGVTAGGDRSARRSPTNLALLCGAVGALCARHGYPRAIVAIAHRLARASSTPCYAMDCVLPPKKAAGESRIRREFLSPCLADRDQHAALARSVELDEHDGLPGAEAELPGADGDRLPGPEDRRLDVRGGVAVDAVVPPDARRHEPV